MKLLVILIFFAMPSAAIAEVKWLGFGSMKCSHLNSISENGIDSEKLAQWTMGLWSGVNLMMLDRTKWFRDFSSITSESEVAQEIRSKCRLTPEKSVISVALTLFETFPMKEAPK